MDPKPDVGRIRARARELSKALLGAQFRAEVAAFIGVAEGPFWARRIGDQLGIPENKVASELSRFARDGLLAAMPSAQWDRRRLYERASGSTGYWNAGNELIERAASEEAIRVGVPAEVAMDAYREHVRIGAS